MKAKKEALSLRSVEDILPLNSISKGGSALAIAYREIYARDKDPFWLRERICKEAKEKGIRPVARGYEMDPRTVRKWMKRDDKHSLKRGPKAGSVETRTPEDRRIRIIETKKATGHGPMRLHMEDELEESPSTIYRILKQAGVIVARRRRWREKGDLRAFKAHYRTFEKLQVDAKTLTDIPALFGPLKELGLPKMQWTARCIKSGATFISYSNAGETQEAACTFMVYVLEHLKKYGVETKGMKIQTDNGSYAVGSMRSVKKSAFRQLLESYGVKHRLIVPGQKTSQADVERFHGLIEQELYRRVVPRSKAEFFLQAAHYQIYFNMFRPNSYKGWQTPLQILNKDLPHVDPQVLALAPIDLDQHTDLYYLKMDPDYLPMTPELFFQDVPSPHYEELVEQAHARKAQVGH